MDILVTLLLIALPLGSVIRLEILPNAFVYPQDITAAILAFYILWKNKTQITQTIGKKIGIAFLFFAGFALVGLLLAAPNLELKSFAVSLLYLLRFALFFMLIFVGLSNTQDTNKKYLLWLLLSGFVTIIAGFIQYFLYPNLRNLYYLGWDDHLNRMFSTFLDPNYAGVFFVLVFILLISFLQSAQKRVYKILFVIMIIVTLAGLLLTYSRGSYIMFAVALLTYFIVSQQKKILVLCCLGALVGVLLIPKNTGGEGVNLLRTFSIFQRLRSVENGIAIFQKSPIYGVGFNTYRYAQERYGLLDKKSEKSHSGAGVSNSYVFLLATTGIVGLILYLNIWRAILNELRARKKILGQYMFAAVVASIGGFFVHALFDNTLFYSSIAVWIYLLVGLSMDGKLRE